MAKHFFLFGMPKPSVKNSLAAQLLSSIFLQNYSIKNYLSFSLESLPLWLRLNYYTKNIGGHRQQWISHKMNDRQLGQFKKIKSCGPSWSYQLNSTANLANSAHFLGKWAGLAVLFSSQLQNSPQDFDFFQLSWLRNIHFM